MCSKRDALNPHALNRRISCELNRMPSLLAQQLLVRNGDIHKDSNSAGNDRKHSARITSMGCSSRQKLHFETSPGRRYVRKKEPPS